MSSTHLHPDASTDGLELRLLPARHPEWTWNRVVAHLLVEFTDRHLEQLLERNHFIGLTDEEAGAVAVYEELVYGLAEGQCLRS